MSPNVVFILSDQHNAKCLGHKEHPDVKTPNLDRLAEQGVRFDNAIAQNPICTPSRMCYLSGQYCHNHGYYGLCGPNPNGLPTVIGHFRRHGYTTAAIGKIHCPEYWVEDDCDVFHETAHSSIRGRSKAYAAYLEERGLTGLEDHARFNEFGERGRQKFDGRPSAVAYRDGQEGWIATTSIEFMRSATKQGRPFFLHVSLPKPHQCYTPAREFWDLYDENALTLPPNADHEDPYAAPNLVATRDSQRRGHDWLFEPRTYAAGRLRKLHGYFGSISHVDHAVGELVDWIDANGIADDTIVVYATDHGDYALEHGLLEKAPGIGHDAITRIPFIWRWPSRFKAGHTCEELVETVDVSATLAQLCGLPPLETSDGQDIAHLLRGRPGSVRDIAVTEFPWSKSVRKGDWRLVWYPKAMFADTYPDGFGQLYNLADDPWEMHNLYFDPAFADKVRELKDDLTDWLMTTTRPVTTLGPSQPPTTQTIRRYNNTINADGKMRAQTVPGATHRNYL